MRRRLVRRVGLVAALLVAAVLLLHLLLAHALPVETVTRWISEDLGFPVHVDAVAVRILPSPRVRLRGIQIADGIAVGRAKITLRILPLLWGDLEGGRAWLERVELGVVRRADGGVEIEGMGARAEAEPLDDEAAPTKPTGIPSLPPIELRDTLVHYIDHTVPGGPDTSDVHFETVQLRTRHAEDGLRLVARGRLDAADAEPNLHVEATVGAPAEEGRPVRVSIEAQGVDPEPVPPHLPAKWGIRGVKGPFDGRIDLAWNDPRGFHGELDLRFASAEIDYAGIHAGGAVSFQAKLHDEGRFRLSDGVVQADRASLEPIRGEPVNARFAFHERTVTLEELRFGAWDGTVKATGTVTVDDPPAFDLELDARDLSLHSLENLRGGEPSEDPIRMQLRGPVHGHWTGGGEWLAPVAGTVALSMHGGEVLSGDMLESLARALTRYFAERHEQGQESAMDTTPLEKLQGTFSLASARAETEDLVVVTKDYEIDSAGWLHPSGEYAFAGGLSFTPRGLSRLLASASIRGRHDARGGLPRCPFAISGNLRTGEFQVELDEEPLAALVFLPWAVDELSEGGANAFDAGKRGVDRTVEFFEGLDGREPAAVPEERASSLAEQPEDHDHELDASEAQEQIDAEQESAERRGERESQ